MTFASADLDLGSPSLGFQKCLCYLNWKGQLLTGLWGCGVWN